MVQGVDTFDDIVIGTSPLMLLQARYLAAAGRRVCVLNREEQYGGSWMTAFMDNGEKIEVACHLIEFFPNVYETLEDASGVPFEVLDNQPIRVNRLNIIIPYFSRILLLASGARLVLGYCRAIIEKLIFKNSDRNKFLNFQAKLWSWLRYQTPALLKNAPMKGPQDGFVDFLDNLILRCIEKGVLFHIGDVRALTRTSDRWSVELESGDVLCSYHVHSTTSTNLRVVEAGRLRAVEQTFVSRCAIAIEVPLDHIKISQTYVAFWHHPMIARISRVDRPGNYSGVRFLVEIHDEKFYDLSEFDEHLRTWMEQADMVKNGFKLTLLGKVYCRFTANVDQLPRGEIEQGLWGYYSLGNLAAGIAHWLTVPRLPPLPCESKR